jgi:hypothetical protein
MPASSFLIGYTTFELWKSWQQLVDSTFMALGWQVDEFRRNFGKLAHINFIKGTLKNVMTAILERWENIKK